MASDARSRLKEWLASGQARLQPLTFPQRELWETAPVPPADPSNIIRSILDIRGPLTVDMCRRALGMVIERQEVMRTTFLPGKERPVQLVRSVVEPVLDYRELDGVADDEAVLRALGPTFTHPFDLLAGPLYRLTMLRRGPDHFALGLAIHHALADGWTVTSFVEDFCTACVVVWRQSGQDMTRLQGVRDALPPLAMTYGQWGAAERARWTPADLARQAVRWRERLAGAGPFFAVDGPVGAEPLEKWVTHLPAELAEAARTLARRTGATPFSALAAVFRIALHRWRGKDDVVLGTPVAGRAKSAVRETMGYFSEVVPLRCRIDPMQRIDAVVRQVHDEALEDFARAMPFAELAAAVNTRAARPRHLLYDVRFAVQNHPFPDIVIPGIATRLQTLSSGTSRFDLACELTEDGKRFEIIWLFRPAAAARPDVADLDRLFRAVLEDSAT